MKMMQSWAVDVVILEVGLGGRLDATNIIDPNLAVITTIDLDHQDWLGNTREKIAREKAGIMRKNGNAVLVNCFLHHRFTMWLTSYKLTYVGLHKISKQW